MTQLANVSTPHTGPSIRLPATRPVPKGRELVEAQLSLVVSEARRMARRLPSHVKAEDLIGNGCMGLLAAAQRFDPSRGAEFASFARLKIRAAMLDELRELDLLPRRARASLNKLDRIKRGFTATHGREPSRLELAAASQMTAKAVDELMSLSERAQAPEQLEIAENHICERSNLAEHAERNQAVSRLTDAIKKLGARHQQVLSAYYQGDLTFREIGQLWGVTESRVCQLHAEAVKSLRRSI